ncbi:hypothetical protein PGT21_005078 [Puccinia graminis f. sp. tritici]|uniref:tripeptidyl-peptidase II n=1 Tax=Puccinia graminis f. sp. tritici TaxID=56615 RepID=A0A5B0N5X3_PUCGR|nr:hypothetical protein PGTUg99_035828 [Puccinia graminis f. sp. tritici]KAA1093976.1 hypothetical protein PGT21_005078 [Puccinia graminis f. sp. tritici]
MMAINSASFVALSYLFSLLMAFPMPDSPQTSSSGFRLFEAHQAPRSFTKREIPQSHKHTLNLKIALKSGGMDLIKKRLVETSDPESSSYGRHLTFEEIRDLSAPSNSSLEAIVKWLSSHGFDESAMDWSHSKDWVSLNQVPLQKAEEMLDTTYFYYQHDDGQMLLRTERYSLPEEIHSHVELIQPTTMFGRLAPKRSMFTSEMSNQRKHKSIARIRNNRRTFPIFNTPAPAQTAVNTTACKDPASVTNACLRELYQTDSYRLQTQGNANRIGVTAYIGERANYEDLKDFLMNEGLPTTNNFTVVSVNGGLNPQTHTVDELARHVGVEGNLDIQTTMGFTAPMPNIFYTTAGSPPFQADLFTPTNSNEPYLDWLLYIASQPDSAVPQVISTSYGDDEQTVPANYAKRVCDQLAALTARGVSLIFSSGDDGVGQAGTCLSNDGKNTPRFMPIFPATCPYVTSVGATQRFHPEEAVSVDGPGGFPSGGGFSEYFDRPQYQSQQVQTYLNLLGSNYTGLYNPKGRGVPDVSAQGAKYLMTWQKLHVHVGGSSAAAPTFASVIALLNDNRIARGMPALGFLNPWLYSQGYKALNDIVIGSSSGCGTTGFAAAKGWDPVTGLGTPNFPAMLRAMPAQDTLSSRPDPTYCKSSIMSMVNCHLGWRVPGF